MITVLFFLLYPQTHIDDDNSIAEVNYSVIVHVGSEFVEIGGSPMQRIECHHENNENNIRKGENEGGLQRRQDYEISLRFHDRKSEAP